MNKEPHHRLADMEQAGAADKLKPKTAYALLQSDGHLFKASPVLEEITVSWNSAKQWWLQFAAQSAAPAPTQCPVCQLGQRLGVVRSSLFEPETQLSPTEEPHKTPQNLRTFEVTYSGHAHILADNNTTDMLLIRDVTKQQQQNESVRHKISQYESICNFIQDVYYRIDMEGEILFISPSCNKLLYYHPEELLGTPLADLTVTQESFQELLDILQNTHAVHDYYLLMHCKKGLQIPVSLTAKLVFGTDGQRLAIEGIFRDVSERERLGSILEERKFTYQETLSRLEHFKSAIDQHAMVSVTNPDGEIVSVNEKFLETSRYSQEEILGKTHKTLNSGYHPKSFFKEMWRTIVSGSVWRGEIRNRKKNGDLFWVECSIVPFLTPLGQPFQYISVATDISSQVRARMRMERNRDFLHRVINAMGEGVIVMDLQGRLLALNQEGERLIGWQETELMHKNVHEAIHTKRPDGSLLATLECTVHQSLLGRAFRVEDDHYLCKDNTFLPVSHVTSPLRDGKEIIGSITVFQDNRRSRKRLMELEHVSSSAVESSRLKSEFLANMSHEIRTPMNAIIGMNDLLMDTQLNDEQLEFAEIIRDSAKSLISLINDILDFSKIEAGKIDIEEIDFSPVTVVEGCAELLATQAQEKGLSLMTFISPKLPKILKGDPGRLRQMLINLMGNAIKFTAEGEVVVRVEQEFGIHTKAQLANQIMLRFSVTDTGIGLSKQAKEQLFEPFTQADRTTSRKYGGTGLGLAISKRLTELMGGTIGIDTAISQQFGEGTAFWFRIPFQHSPTTLTTDCLVPDCFVQTDILQNVRILTVLKNATDQAILENYFCSWGMLHQGQLGEAKNLTTIQHDITSTPSLAHPFHLAVIALSPSDTNHKLLLNAEHTEQQNAEHTEQPQTIKGQTIKGQTIKGQTIKWVALLDREDKLLRDFILNSGFSACLIKPVRQEEWFQCFSQLLTPKKTTTLLERQKTSVQKTASQVSNVESETTLASQETNSADPNAYNALESGKLLLLVEDNPVNQKVTLLQLKKLGYAAHAVNNGREAVEAVANLPYALVLMDCQMPVMDGFEATHAIRKMYETGENRTSWHHIPIVAMTANAMKGDRERCLQAGMDDYLSKPVAPKTLLKKLQYWIPQGSGELPAIEIQQLRQLFGDDDGMIRELLQHFPSSARELLDRLQQSIQKSDKTLLNDTAFELQEACANMGAVGMAKVAHNLEYAAVKNDWAKAKTAMEQLEREFSKVEIYVQDY